MAKVWRVVISIVGIVILLGGVCVLVGVITGGDFERIKALFDVRFDVEAIRHSVELKINDIFDLVKGFLPI